MRKKKVTRNSETLASFVKYCKEHPYQRFWQVLRDWSGYPYVLVRPDPLEDTTADTYYWDGRRG